MPNSVQSLTPDNLQSDTLIFYLKRPLRNIVNRGTFGKKRQTPIERDTSLPMLSILFLRATEHRYLRLESEPVHEKPIMTVVLGDSSLPGTSGESSRRSFQLSSLTQLRCTQGGTLPNKYSFF
jgi:hypothetical protein